MKTFPTIYDAVATMHREGITFGQREAAKLVGGRTRLEKLIAEGRIRTEKKSLAQNAKWYCNGGDVLCYVRNRPRRIGTRKKNNNQ